MFEIIRPHIQTICTVWQFPALAILLLSLIAFCLYGIDKWKAQTGRWRISEKTLLLSAFFFGALGAFLGMQIFRHKTKHWYFRILIPFFLILQIAVYLAVILISFGII